MLAAGLCSEHQYSLYLELNDETLSFIEDVFGDKIVADEDGCWIWTGRLKDGYSSLRVNGRWVIGHRWLYMHLVGPIPNGQELHHECEKPRCVRPGHLRPLVPVDHRHVTAFTKWMFMIAPDGKLAIDNVTRSQRERRYAETYRLPFGEAFLVEESESHHQKLPIPSG